MGQAEKNYLSPTELVARWGGKVTAKTLANWRSKKDKEGPAFQKFGGRIGYAISDVVAYERRRRFSAGSGEAQGATA